LREKFGTTSLAVIAITFILFVLALFTKGFTHDLLLEAAVFLVSVKLIMLGYRHGQSMEAIERKLDLIFSEEQHLEKLLNALRQSNPGEGAKMDASKGA
jgi:hypothetical protein